MKPSLKDADGLARRMNLSERTHGQDALGPRSL